MSDLEETRSKYGNHKTVLDGVCFDSKAEARRYQELQLLELAGEIEKLELKPRFVLQDAFRDRAGKHQAAISYTPDFAYFERGHYVVEDVKGGRATQTQVFQIKRKLFQKRYPDIEIRVVEG